MMPVHEKICAKFQIIRIAFISRIEPSNFQIVTITIIFKTDFRINIGCIKRAKGYTKIELLFLCRVRSHCMVTVVLAFNNKTVTY